MDDSDSSHSENLFIPQFANKFFENVPKDSNTVLSSISAEILLAMLHQGTAGDTTKNFATILNITNKKDSADKYKTLLENLSKLTNMTLDIANKIFIMDGFSIRDTYKNVLQDNFFSRADSINFAENVKAAGEINQWVEQQTHDKIKNLIAASSLDSLTRLILVNALYFKGCWRNSFIEEDTTMDQFFVSDEETIDCKMIFISERFSLCHSKTLNASLIELPYINSNISMIIILPSDYDGIEKLENDLTKVDLSNLMENPLRRVELSLPKFRIESTIDLKPILTGMGLKEIFDPCLANFSEMSEKSNGLYVSEFVQKVLIEVHEKNTGGAAATRSGIRKKAGPKRLVVDHPFLFTLQAMEENGNTVLFVGKVLRPQY